MEETQEEINMTTIELKLSLPDELLATLQREAEERDLSLDEIVVDVLHDYFDEPTKEDILMGIHQGMRDALMGNTRPAHEFLDELDQEIADDAN
jgi:predicted transcriptional regulator